jgi:hypothetical protein
MKFGLVWPCFTISSVFVMSLLPLLHISLQSISYILCFFRIAIFSLFSCFSCFQTLYTMAPFCLAKMSSLPLLNFMCVCARAHKRQPFHFFIFKINTFKLSINSVYQDLYILLKQLTCEINRIPIPISINNVYCRAQQHFQTMGHTQALHPFA